MKLQKKAFVGDVLPKNKVEAVENTSMCECTNEWVNEGLNEGLDEGLSV